VQVDRNIDRVTEALAQRMKTFRRRGELGAGLERAHGVRDRALEGGEFLFGRESRRALDIITRRGDVDPAVEPDAIAHGAAEQLVNRGLQVLAQNIPQCLIEARKCRANHRPGAVECAAKKVLPDMLDPARILPDEPSPHLLQHRFHREAAAFQRRLAEASQTRIRVHPDHEPARSEVEGFEPGDAHRVELGWHRRGENASQGFS
jgi:hypothetical protein